MSPYRVAAERADDGEDEEMRALVEKMLAPVRAAQFWAIAGAYAALEALKFLIVFT